MAVLTPEELFKKLDALGNVCASPEITKSFMDGAALAEGTAKRYCTPGQSPYWKAPYSDDREGKRNLAHMRDQITSTVIADVPNQRLHGVVFVRGSAPGEPYDYALPVHTGTYDYFTSAGSSLSGEKADGMKGMPPRPVIPDAIMANQASISKIIQGGIKGHIARVCQENVS